MIEKDKLIDLLTKGDLIVGGSFLYKDNFKDIDLFLVLKDELFGENFLNPLDWKTQRESGDWGPGMWKFREYSIQLREIVKEKLQSKHPVDFWIIPESYRFETNR